MGDTWVSYRRSSRMTLTDLTSLNSRTDCIFDISVRSWNQYWLDPPTFINVRLASCVRLFTCSCVERHNSNKTPAEWGTDEKYSVTTDPGCGVLFDSEPAVIRHFVPL